jgi:hypothetical protein
VSNPVSDDPLAQVHDAPGGIDIGWTDGCAFIGAMTTPESIVLIGQIQQLRRCGLFYLFLDGGQDCRA